MSYQPDESFRRDLANKLSMHWLGKAESFLKWACVVGVVIKLILVCLIVSRCTPIYGLSLSGKLFPTDSYTCPIPNVPKLFRHESSPNKPNSKESTR
ncbi:Uncharacterised protein [Achromobacter sp. 2789STDY5608633]|jgi:hypothetical protein|uniref:hypothetical protein n=1 Tax=Pseudomonadota TaxID=1224 RepID=UPI0006BF5B3E|nr:hypothetical protein [Achromobacter sp. 2789STDY5608633]CUJ50644.1 Uncharacterised protein [Achromobacter sp. 2789STDY5608633]